MRRLLLLLVLAMVGLGQTMTNNEVNGLGWRTMNEVGKVYFVMGTFSGGTVLESWTLSDLPACVDHINKQEYPSITNAALIQEIDKFYETASNAPLPVSIAVLMTYMRLNGATKEQLEKFRAAMLKTYVQ
jgi:hypothetical protein